MIGLRSLTDFYKKSKNPISPRIEHETFELSTLVDGTLKRVEYKQIKKVESPFNFRDFSLDSILASGNTALLNPVGAISSNNMDVSDVVDSHAAYIEKLQSLQSAHVEPEN